MSSGERLAVRLRGAGKRYRSRWAIQHVNLDIGFGEVVGFIGPNGAGKSTLIKLMAGLAGSSSGEITVLGSDLAGRLRTPDGVGLVAEHPQFVPYLSGRTNLRLLARIRNVANEADIVRTLQRVGLDPEDRRAVRGYSLGMRQRLGVGQALMERPRLLLLDEPTNGLDPRGIVEFRELIRELAGEGVAVFVASHLLTEVERVCDRVLFVRAGQVLEQLSLHETESPGVRVSVSATEDLAVLREWAKSTNTMATDSEDTYWPAVELQPRTGVPEMVNELVHAGVRLEAVEREQRSLEQRFLALTSEQVAT